MKTLIHARELEQCTCFNLRKMARELTNNYNNSLKSNGVTNTDTHFGINKYLQSDRNIKDCKIIKFRIINLKKKFIYFNKKIN